MITVYAELLIPKSNKKNVICNEKFQWNFFSKRFCRMQVENGKFMVKFENLEITICSAFWSCCKNIFILNVNVYQTYFMDLKKYKLNSVCGICNLIFILSRDHTQIT